jgi:hypothetical protein
MASEQLTVHQCQCAHCQDESESGIVRYHTALNRMLAVAPERQRRLIVGSLSQQPGGSTDEELSRITGLSRHTIQKGREERRKKKSATRTTLDGLGSTAYRR